MKNYNKLIKEYDLNLKKQANLFHVSNYEWMERKRRIFKKLKIFCKKIKNMKIDTKDVIENLINLIN